MGSERTTRVTMLDIIAQVEIESGEFVFARCSVCHRQILFTYEGDDRLRMQTHCDCEDADPELGRISGDPMTMEGERNRLHAALAEGHGVEDGGIWEDRATNAERALAECYRLTGADPDGATDFTLAGEATSEVRRMRAELDAAEKRLAELGE